jgi:peptidyl-dipeptidase Dcp
MNNPLLKNFDTPYATAPFGQIKNEYYKPAFEEAIKEAKSEIEQIKAIEEEANFTNTILALENAGKKLSRISEIFFNLNSAETNDEMQKIAREVSPMLTEYGNDILLDEELFARVKEVFENQEILSLDKEDKRLLEKTFKSFVRNGANLSPEDKEKLREIDKKMADLSLAFGENVLAETNRYELILENEADLAGLPESTIELAAVTAEEKGHHGKWVITLDYPSYVPFMTYAEDRDLRKTLFIAYNTKGLKGDELDNRKIIQEKVKLRYERARLLGYQDYASFILEERMAESSPKVVSFLHDMLQKAKPVAEKEMQELTAFAKQIGGPDTLEKWDFAYYSEKLKKQLFNIDDELLKPYFQLEKVQQGAFEVAEKLFGIRFIERKDIPIYHADVKTYEVVDRENNHVAIFYADFFPRPGKRNGAWMTSYRGQRTINGTEERPHVSIVCNFSKPTATKPSLLTFNEVTTLFHEFGHALHGMLAKGKYESLTGTNVFWDFVELPSQIFENWCYEKECLDLFARHYQTNEPIPEEFIQKIKDSSNFMAGYQTLRQLGFSFLDMAYHTNLPDGLDDIEVFEKAHTNDTNLLPDVSGTAVSPSFGHIFQGGYAAGYYSYKWAEVLDADAFEYFLEKGIFNPEVAESFKTNILAAGGTEHPMELYKRFRGREPKPDALLKRAGLV